MTSEHSKPEAEFLELISSVKPWRRGHERAPHKPLLLLLALARIQRGIDGDVPYIEIDAPLRELLAQYGPPRSSDHPEYPFWYLQNDGLWRVAEAAHVWWHTHDGPSTVDNGVALCALHHRTLDLGVWGLTDQHRIIVSSRVHGGHRVADLLTSYHGAPLRAPQAATQALALDSIRWHRAEVLRQPGRQVDPAA